VVVALVAGSREKEAAASFLADLEGAPARKALDAYGFGPP
jgi:ABC-type molybdate transport system substrate-binding protein